MSETCPACVDVIVARAGLLAAVELWHQGVLTLAAVEGEARNYATLKARERKSNGPCCEDSIMAACPACLPCPSCAEAILAAARRRAGRVGPDGLVDRRPKAEPVAPPGSSGAGDQQTIPEQRERCDAPWYVVGFDGARPNDVCGRCGVRREDHPKS